MRLIDIVSKVILERTITVEPDRDEETLPDDEIRTDDERFDGEDIPIGDREERERRDSEERDRRDSEERERRDREERPRVVRGNIREPERRDSEESLRTGEEPENLTKGIKKPNKDTKLLTNPKFETHSDIGNVKKVQTKEFIDSVIGKIELQLKQQPANVRQTLKKYNIDSEVMAKLAPLSKESFTTIMNLEGNGVKLPLLILLFKNKNKLYNSMRTGQPLTEKDMNPISSGINYNQFWKWSSKLDKNWGGWLRNNVVKNFPEISAPTLDF